MKKIKKKELLKILVRQIGDIRVCPYCQRTFIPNDSTSREALEYYVKIKDKK